MPPLTSIRKSPLDQKISEAGGPTTKTVLVVCGEMMRRSKHPSSARPEETERALSALSVSDVTQAVAGLDVASAKGELARAIEDAFEAAFADSEEDRTLFTSSAMSGIAARDRLASAIFGARQKLALASGDAGVEGLAASLATVEDSLAALDEQLRPQVRSLTSVNPERRAELSMLDPELRETAWWYAARSDEGDDQLLAQLGGAPLDSALAINDSAETKADLAASSLPSFDAETEASGVRRAALRIASPGEQTWLDHRATGREPLRRALDLALDTSLEKDESE